MRILYSWKKLYLYLIFMISFMFMMTIEGRSEVYDFEKEDFLKLELQSKSPEPSKGLSDSDKVKYLFEKEVDMLKE